MRVTSGVTRHKRKNRLLKRAKGFVGRRRRLVKVTSETVLRADRFAYIHRRQRKRTIRSLWITRIGAASRIEGLPYGRFINGLNRAGVAIDRKLISELAVREPEAFQALVETAKKALVVQSA